MTCVKQKHFLEAGREIPWWFKFLSMGSSITLELPPGDDWFNNEHPGFAFCVIVAFEEHHYTDQHLDLCFKLKVKTEDGNSHNACDGGLFDYVDLDHIHWCTYSQTGSV